MTHHYPVEYRLPVWYTRALTRFIHGFPVHGIGVGPRTECAHYHSELDVVALKFPCCNRFYPCHECHNLTAGHPHKRWPADSRQAQAVLCGACGSLLNIHEYLSCESACPKCKTQFNSGCERHYDLYFEPVN